MANTYTQLHIQIVFAVQNRDCIIKDDWKDQLYKYITGIIQNKGHKVIQINGLPDHVHILIGLRPTQGLSELVKIVKGESSKWINEKEFSTYKFSWQQGFGAFSYSKSQIHDVIAYIKNQEEHHRKTTFKEEYLQLLTEFEIAFEERYIFHELE